MRVKLKGFRELDRALSDLGKATARNVLRRVGTAALTPMRNSAKAKVRVDTGTLRDSIRIETAKDAEYAKAARAAFKSSGSAAGVKRSRSKGVSLVLGPSARPKSNAAQNARFQERGTEKMSAQPYMRPAWDAEKQGALTIIEDQLGAEITKAAKRAAKKAAKGKS